MIRFLLILLFALPVWAKKPPPPPSDDVTWTKQACVGEWWGGCVQGAYTPATIEPTGIRVFSNQQDLYGTAGDLYIYPGTWSLLQAPLVALHITDPRDTYIRTHGVAKGASGTYYAVLYTGDGYPTQSGYSPSWATSPDGVAWAWWGPIGIFGRNQSSANNLIVDEARTDSYRFMAWLDLPTGLFLMHAATGLNDWQSDGVNVWPLAEVPQFMAAVKTPYGYHLIGADKFDGTTTRSLRHAFSCTGLPPWHVIETTSDVGVGTTKGTNLVFDGATNLIHALTSGQHFTLAAKNFGC